MVEGSVSENSSAPSLDVSFQITSTPYKWLQHKQKKSLHEALEKIKAELMLLGFISLLLTVCQEPISDICIPSKVARTWHPCNDDSADHDFDDPCLKKRKVQMVSNYGIHQLHIFIFVLAVVHVSYCLLTLVLGRLKMRRWKVWEDETRTVEYQYHNDPERFRFARETTFGRRHLRSWSTSTTLLWIGCFFRQFFTSVAKVDYLTLRHGFINNAFQLAFLWWSWDTFGRTCFHRRTEDIIIRITMGVVIQFLCSYMTLPLYALVTQMGSRMKPTIFSENVAKGLKSWQHTAKKNIKHGHHLSSNTPFSSRPGTPLHGSTSPVNLLHRHPIDSLDSLSDSPRGSGVEHEGWANESTSNNRYKYEEDPNPELEEEEILELSSSSTQPRIGPGDCVLKAPFETGS
ncbi:hypothetical protein R6Q57_013416 [Mikania cordata]